MPKTLSDWYCLKPGRANFTPNVERDRELVFCHKKKIEDEILISIEKRFAAKRPVKMVLYGDWGVGKTHTIYHISWWFEHHQSDYQAQTFLIEIGDITSKSRFDVLVGPFLDKIGLKQLINLAHDYQPATGKHLVNALKDCRASANVAAAFGKLLLAPRDDTPPPAVLTTFEFLKGQKPKEAASIGLGTFLSQSEEFFSVLLCCGELFRAVNKKQLIFIADEAAKLEDLDSDDATRRHWIAANRMIFDDNNDVFGFIYTLSGAGKKQMPSVLQDPQIVNRLGENNLIHLQHLEQTDVVTFLGRLRESFVNRECVDALVASSEIAKSDYAWDRYPFTESAWQEFIDHWNRNSEDAKPRDICDKLDDAAFRALKDNKRLIDQDALQKAM